MLRLMAIAAVATVVAGKTYIFNAAKCNTNFDNMQNWANPDVTAADGQTMDTPVSGSPPSKVEFSSTNGVGQSVEVRVNGGDYELGKLKLQRNMKIKLDVEGVSMNLNAAARGTTAFFVAGQDTSNPACSLGCHSNYFQYLGRGGEEGAVDINLDDFVGDDVVFDEGSPIIPAEETPCNVDSVVIPKRYGVNLLAIGFHPFKELVYPASEERLVSIESAADVPDYMFFPTTNQKVFLGPEVLDDCSDHGLIHDDECICISECPAPEDALTESNRLRNAAKAFAQREIKAYESTGARERFKVAFANAFEPGNVDRTCRVGAEQVADLVEEYTGNHLSSLGIDVTIDTATASIEATGILTGRAGDFFNQELLPDEPIGILSSVTLPGSGVGATDEDIDLAAKDSTQYQLLMTVYHAIVDEMADQCRLRGSSDLLEDAGIERVRQERTKVYGGSNLPQIDVNRLVDDNNKAGAADHVYEGIKDIQGFEDLNKAALLANWGLATPEDRTKGRRAARLGLATNLILCNLEYSRWSTGSGVDTRHVEQVINHLLATYDTQTHHQCFTFNGGYDDECIASIVSKAIELELSAESCGKGNAASCKTAASNTALEIIMEIKGCGLLGSIPGPGGIPRCADPDAEAANEALADSFANNLTDFAVQAKDNEYASSVEGVRQAKLAAEEARVAAAYAEELNMNATAADRAARQNRIALEQKALALEFSSGASEAEVELRVQQSESEVAQKQAEFDAAFDAFMECLNMDREDRGSLTPADYGCVRAEKVMWVRMDNLKAAQEFQRIIQAKHVKMTLEKSGTNDKGDFVLESSDKNALILRADDLLVQANAKKADLADAQSELQSTVDDVELNGCDDPEKAAGLDEDGVVKCTELKMMKQALEEKVAHLENDIEQTETDAADINASAEAAAAPEELGFFDETLNLVIVAAGGLIFIIIIIGVALLMKGGPASSGDWQDDQRNVVAFENPMYDDPNQGMGMAMATKQPSVKKAKAAAPVEDDGGLYDEPEFNEDEGGGGYLDVEADSDDDDDEDESDDDDSDDDSDDDE